MPSVPVLVSGGASTDQLGRGSLSRIRFERTKRDASLTKRGQPLERAQILIVKPPDMRCLGFPSLGLMLGFALFSGRAAEMSNFPDRFDTFGFSLVQKLETSGQRKTS